MLRCQAGWASPRSNPTDMEGTAGYDREAQPAPKHLAAALIDLNKISHFCYLTVVLTGGYTVFSKNSHTMRFMGLDFGSKYIGIAVSDEAGLIASPRKSLRRTNLEKDIEHLASRAREEEAGAFVVGMPLSLDGSEGPQAKKVMGFINRLGQVSGIHVTPWDERLTTVAAQRSLIEADVSRARRKKVVDKVAAAIMLQSYLDYRSLKQSSEESLARQARQAQPGEES